MHRGDEARRNPGQHRARRTGRRGRHDRGAAVGSDQACRARRLQHRTFAGGSSPDETAERHAVGAFGVPHARGQRKSDRGGVAALPKDREGEVIPTIYSWTAILNGGHAEPVIGRAFARPGGFAHRSARRHCERSEAIQNRAKGLDCFVAALLGRKSLKNGVILPTSSLKLSSKAGRCLIHRSQLAMTKDSLPPPISSPAGSVTVRATGTPHCRGSLPAACSRPSGPWIPTAS